MKQTFSRGIQRCALILFFGKPVGAVRNHVAAYNTEQHSKKFQLYAGIVRSFAAGTPQSKNPRSPSARRVLAAATLNVTPSPGRSHTSMKPLVTIGLGRPSTMSYHHS